MSLCPFVQKKKFATTFHHEQYFWWKYSKPLSSLLKQHSRDQRGGQSNRMTMSFLSVKRQKSLENGFYDGHYEVKTKAIQKEHLKYSIRISGSHKHFFFTKERQFSLTAYFSLFSFDKLESITNLKERLISLHHWVLISCFLVASSWETKKHKSRHMMFMLVIWRERASSVLV